MPWCDDCAKFWNPSSMGDGGECPTCGRVIATPRQAPWHFKLLMVAVALYLGFRAYQGAEWLIGRL